MVSTTKEIHRLMRRVARLTDKQASVTNIDWDGEVQQFTVCIRPNGGPYKNGQFEFQVSLGETYPDEAPKIWCLTDIYHPNIDNTDPYGEADSTNVCLNLLEEGTWSCTLGLEGVVLGLVFLMFNPNLEDPLSPHFDGQVDEERFLNNVEKYLAGEAIDDGTVFKTTFTVIDGVRVEDVSKSNKLDEDVSTVTQPDTKGTSISTESTDNVVNRDEDNKVSEQTKEPVTPDTEVLSGTNTEDTAGKTNDSLNDTKNNTEVEANPNAETTVNNAETNSNVGETTDACVNAEVNSNVETTGDSVDAVTNSNSETMNTCVNAEINSDVETTGDSVDAETNSNVGTTDACVNAEVNPNAETTGDSVDAVTNSNDASVNAEVTPNAETTVENVGGEVNSNIDTAVDSVGAATHSNVKTTGDNVDAATNSNIEITGDDEDESLPISMICIDGEYVLCLETSVSEIEDDKKGISLDDTTECHQCDETFKTENQNTIVDEDLNSVNTELSDLISKDRNDEKKFNGSMSATEHMARKSMKAMFTCGLWSSFKVICYKLVHDLISRKINNDLV